MIMNIDQGSPAEHASLLIGDLLIGTPETRFATAFDLADVIAEADGRLRLRFLRGDNAREREVVISLGGKFASEAA
jgi:S1-C subfamily serine protease